MPLAISQVQAYLKRNPEEKDICDCFIQFIGQQGPSVHQFTGSSWLVNPMDQTILLTHHKRLGRWLQLGGHRETSDQDIQATALREAQEESGINDLSLLSEDIFHLGIHYIPDTSSTSGSKHKNWSCPSGKTSNAHYHFDACFVHTVTPEHAQKIRVSDESNHLAWFPLSRILTMSNKDSQLHKMAQKWQIQAYSEYPEPA